MTMRQHDPVDIRIVDVTEQVPPGSGSCIQPDVRIAELEEISGRGSFPGGEHPCTAENRDHETHEASHGLNSIPLNAGPNSSSPNSENIPSSLVAMNRCLPTFCDGFSNARFLSSARTSTRS